MLPRTRGWVESWDRVKGLPEEDLQEYLVKKCRNGFQMAKKPSRDQRDAWCHAAGRAGQEQRSTQSARDADGRPRPEPARAGGVRLRAQPRRDRRRRLRRSALRTLTKKKPDASPTLDPSLSETT